MANDTTVEKALADFMAAAMPEIEALVREHLRMAFIAGLSVGQERNKHVFAAMTMKALEAVKALQDATSAVEAKIAAPAVPPPAARKNGGYSGITEAVRRTLRDIGRVAAGIDASRIQKHIADSVGRRDITVQQVRSSLKLLQESGEAERLERGYYRAGPKLAFNGSVPNGNASLFQHPPVAVQ